MRQTRCASSARRCWTPSTRGRIGSSPKDSPSSIHCCPTTMRTPAQRTAGDGPLVRGVPAWPGFVRSTSRQLKDRLAAEPLSDIIRDMLQITRAAIDEESDEEDNEAAYVEIVEYIRVAAQLAYEEIWPTIRHDGKADEARRNLNAGASS